MAKGPDAFRTISEAAEELGVPQHVLRFWETRFTFIRPMKRAGGRRFYRPQDVAVLRGVRRLLHDQGLAIKDVQKLHREGGLRQLIAAGEGEGIAPAPAAAPLRTPRPTRPAAEAPPANPRPLLEALAELEAVKTRLDGLLAGRIS